MARKKAETIASEIVTETENKEETRTKKSGGKSGTRSKKAKSTPEEKPVPEQEEAAAAPEVCADTAEPEACAVSEEAGAEGWGESEAETAAEQTEEPQTDMTDLPEEDPESAEEAEPSDESGEELPEDGEEEAAEDEAADPAVGTEIAVVEEEPVDMSEVTTALKETGKIVAFKCAGAAKKVGSVTKNAFKSGARGTSDYCKRRRLNRLIMKEQQAMDSLCVEIGKLVYRDFLDGDVFRDDIEVLCRAIQAHEMEIPPIRLERAKIHGNTICKNCGAEMSENAAFCPACGAAVIVTPEIPENVFGEAADNEGQENPEALAEGEAADAVPENPEAPAEGEVTDAAPETPEAAAEDAADAETKENSPAAEE